MSTFNEQGFEKKLLALKDSQESISTLSDWCLQNRQHHKKIVTTWLNVLKKVRVENRLTLFYLANDVIQYSKRKNYDFVESWGTALQKATTMVRHDKVMDRIMRIFKIWGERSVYNEEFLTDLRGLLTAKRATPATPQTKQSEQSSSAAATTMGEFIPSNLFLRMTKCKDLEDDTDLKLKVVNECKLKLNDLDAFRNSLKDRRHADGVAGELDDAISQMENYKKALEVEILERRAVIDLLQQAAKFYENEKSDAKVVFNAYRNFGSRVKSLKRKLDELIPTLASPMPSPDINAPSPSPDSDIDLPNDEDLSGIVECLEDIGDKVIESESEDDLMSLYSYYSSDDENSLFSRYDWKNMSSHTRRQYLPVPKPAFSDSDLTELDDSLEDIEEPSFNLSKGVENCTFLTVQPYHKTSECDTSNIQGSLNKKTFLKASTSDSTSKSAMSSIECNSVKPYQTEHSIGVVFKEPEHRKISHSSSERKIKSIEDAGCHLVNDALSFARGGDVDLSLIDVNGKCSLATDKPDKDIRADTDSTGCVTKGPFADVEGDFLPTEDDLSGLLECLQDEFVETGAENPIASSSPAAKKHTS